MIKDEDLITGSSKDWLLNLDNERKKEVKKDVIQLSVEIDIAIFPMDKMEDKGIEYFRKRRPHKRSTRNGTTWLILFKELSMVSFAVQNFFF